MIGFEICSFICFYDMFVIHVGGNDWDTSVILSDGKKEIEKLSSRVAKEYYEFIVYLVKNGFEVTVLFTPSRPIYSNNKWRFMMLLKSKVLSFNLNDNVHIVDLSNIHHTTLDYRVDMIHLNEKGHLKKANLWKQRYC